MAVKLSLRGYAKHRGCALSAVQRAIKDGRIATDKNGKIDPEACDLAWENATDPAMRRQVKVQKVTKNSERFASARAEREDFTARLQRVAYEEKAKILIRAEAAEKRYFENSRAVRDALLALPAEHCMRLASMTDPLVIETFLHREFVRVLEGLAGSRAAGSQADEAPAPL